MGGECVLVERAGPVVTVTLNRPEVHNAFDAELIARLKAVFDSLAADRGVRVVVLAGAGHSFCAGADLAWMERGASLSEEENRRDAVALAAMLRSVAECPQPVVARVHGSALGGGAGLVAAADIAVGAETARFGFSEVRLGLAPATVAPYVVSKIGPARALALFLTAERFDAARALALGLVHRVTPETELNAAVEEVVRQLLDGGPEAHRACKELVRRVAETEGAETDRYTSELIARLRSSEEGREGVRGFLEKRRPAWAGSDALPDERRRGSGD